MKMLETAFKRQETDKVYIDLLTQQDVAAMKAKKQGLPVQQPDSSQADPRGKRYLIMTLFGEYEKCHYPMPLSFLEEPDITLLRRTFTRMQSQI